MAGLRLCFSAVVLFCILPIEGDNVTGLAETRERITRSSPVDHQESIVTGPPPTTGDDALPYFASSTVGRYTEDATQTETLDETTTEPILSQNYDVTSGEDSSSPSPDETLIARLTRRHSSQPPAKEPTSTVDPTTAVGFPTTVDGTVPDEGLRGPVEYELSWEDCRGNVTTIEASPASVIIVMKGYSFPVLYADDRRFECYWHLTVPPGFYVEAQFHGLYNIMRFQPKCIDDRLVIYDGRKNDSVALDVYCGQPRQEPGANGANFRPNCSRYGRTFSEEKDSGGNSAEDDKDMSSDENAGSGRTGDHIQILSTSNEMFIVLNMTGATARHGFNVTVNASEIVRALPSREVTVNRSTSKSGFVFSPCYGCHTLHYPRDLDSWASVQFDENDMLLLSARALDLEHTDNCTADYLAICEGHDGKSEDCIRLCHPLFLPLLTFSRSPVRFHFRSDLTVQASGFLLYYSYLYELAVPTRINDTHHYLDCSTAYYPEVKEHVACNLYPDCQDGRDEMYCGTTVPECDGWYAFRNSCYEYVFTDGDGITWDDAQMECEEKHYGGHLVSINTPEEKAFVRSLLMQGLDNKYVHAGLSTAEDALPQLYRQMWTWADKTVGYYVSLNGSRTGRMCTMIEPKTSLMLVTVDCEDTVPADYLCEWRQSNVTNDSSWYEEIPVIEVPDDRLRDRVNFAECPLGHLTHDFLTCDSESDCGVTREMRVCSLRDGKPIIQYGCERGGRVSFTLLCDFRPDCPDGSDEEFCVPRECTDGEWKCRNKQCIREKDRCDGIFHCMDRSDEENCYICAPGFIYCHTIGCIPGPGQLERNRTLQCGAYGSVNEERRYFVSEHVSRLSPPSIVVPDGYGNFTQCKLSGECPETHFQCPDNGNCLPIYMRCNDVYDCPGHEDEYGCDEYTCRGFYRCRNSRVCVHFEHICDGIFHCPQRDDEWLCHNLYTCPEGCGCLGLAFDCDVEFQAENFTELRYIDASGTNMEPRMFRKNFFLVRLNLASCNLAYVTFPKLRNLRYLDLSSNNLTLIETKTFKKLENLQTLLLSGNPLTDAVSLMGHGDLDALRRLDLSFVSVVELRGAVFEDLPNLRILNLSYTGLDIVSEGVFKGLTHLEELDLRGCPVRMFPGDIFQDLESLKRVHADNYKLCCPETLPYGFSAETCYAPTDEVSSCADLLRSDVLRVSLWAMAGLALLGNMGSFGYRLYCETLSPKNGHGVFITNLALSDFLMGAYLAIIGVADAKFRFRYLWNDLTWRTSTMCKVAGFLSLLSSEVSVFIICLITLDRFIAIRFPFHSFRFSKCSAQLACAIAWVVGFILAVIPLSPLTHHWDFYGQSGICIPLPITKTTFLGRSYIFGVMIVLNFTLFVLIALGQGSIYIAIRNTGTKVKKSRKSEDTKIAHRLASVVVTDFLCWFPIGLLGLLSSNGTPISSEVNVAMAIFVLPLNSALNPFLYTYNMISERMRQRKETSLIKEWENKVTQEKVSEYLKNALKSPEARSLLQQWVSDGVLETSDVAMALASTSDKADSDTESSRASEEIIAIVKHWAKDGLVDAEELTEALRSLSEDGQKTEEGDGKTTESDKGRANGQATNGVVKGSAMNGRCSRSSADSESKGDA